MRRWEAEKRDDYSGRIGGPAGRFSPGRRGQPPDICAYYAYNEMYAVIFVSWFERKRKRGEWGRNPGWAISQIGNEISIDETASSPPAEI